MIYLLFTLVASSADMVIPTIPTPSFAPTVANVSSSLSIRPSTSVALVPQAYPPAILTAVSSDLDNIPPRTSSACNCHSSDRTKLSTDIISMPATASLLPQAPSQLSKSTESLSSLSIRAVDSLSQIVDVTMKALIDTVSRDLRELMDALDDLSRAIMRQTGHIVDASRTTSRTMRELIQYRHERAKGRAAELKKLGGGFVSRAGEAFIGRTKVARQKAHSLKDQLMSSEAWQAYEKAHGDWSLALGQKKGEQEQPPPKARMFFGRA